MLWDLHGLGIDGEWNDSRVGERWLASFASLPDLAESVDIRFALNVSPALPTRPMGEPQFRQTDLIEYFVEEAIVTAFFPRYGLLRLDLAAGTTEGIIVSDTLDTYGVFEDLIAIGLSPHLRRRGMYLLHAFAAVSPFFGAEGNNAGVLIVGGIGAGKTTTGMALLDVGWKLLSNDSPIVSAVGEVLSYPGLLAACFDSFDRFASIRDCVSSIAYANQKISLAADSLWPDVWAERARPGAIFFPRIESRADHALEPIGQSEALRLILPHAIEQWDREMIPAHFALLSQLIQSAPAFRLRLGPDTSTLPAIIASALSSANSAPTTETTA